MSNRSNTSSLSKVNNFVGNIKLSLVNIVLLCLCVALFIALFLLLPVASFSQAGFDSATGAVTINVSQLNGLQALLGNNSAVGSAMSFNFIVLLILLLAVAIIPLNIVPNKIVRLVGACIAVIDLTLLFFLPKMIFSNDGTLVFHPTTALMLMIIFLTVATALSINNVFVMYNVKKDITLGEKISAVRSAYIEQSTAETAQKSNVATTAKSAQQPKVEPIAKVDKVDTTTKTATPAKASTATKTSTTADKQTKTTKTSAKKTSTTDKK